MELPKDLKDKIWNYCRLNDITDLNDFMIKTLKKGFDIEVYGLLGETNNDGENLVEKEIIVEKRVEIPVEVIKEVEKVVEVIKEIPVDRVVEKEIYITDDNQINELVGKVSNLEENIFQLNQEIESERKIFSTKVEEMEIFFQKEMSKKNEELDELRRSLDIYLDISKEDNEKIKEDKRKISDLTDKISQLESDVLKLNKDLEEEKKKNKKGDDIYGEEKRGGWFGSNLLNRK